MAMTLEKRTFLSGIWLFENLTLIKNKLMKSNATILTPMEPLIFDKSEILDIRITTAASGKGEKAIRRLEMLFCPRFPQYFMVPRLL